MKYIALLLAMLLLTVGAFAQEAPENKHEVVARGLIYNIEKAIVGANEVVTAIDDSGELEGIISELETLRDSINVKEFTKEDFQAAREQAKGLVSSFRSIVNESLTAEEKKELRETIHEEIKTQLEDRREEYQRLREEFNNKQFERVEKRLRERHGDNFNVSELRERFESGNFSKEHAKELVASLKERAQKWQAMSEEERMAHAKEMKQKAKEVRDKMRYETKEDVRELRNGNMTQEEFIENQKEHRREAISEIVGDDALGKRIADEADRMQDELVDEMDTDGDGEISEEEAMAAQEKLMADMPRPGTVR